jgi:GT2 family glycosyltransferase
MKIHLAFLTYNRLDYTKMALAALLADPDEEFALTIWDNGSSDGTQDYLKTVRDRRIVEIVFSEKNRGQTYVTNKIWSETDAELIGKVDNDCLVTAGWTRILAKAHQDLPRLGVVGCWHFLPVDFDYERAKHKIQTFGNHRIFRHPWVDGSALLVKRKVYLQYGPCREKEYLTGFWLRLALAGYINGFYYPLIYQEHMDDVRSEHNRLKKMPFEEAYKYIPAFQLGHIRDLQTYYQLHKKILDNLLDGSFDPKFYRGWRARCRRLLEKAKDIPKKFAAAGTF